jgi:hypothetical protein
MPHHLADENLAALRLAHHAPVRVVLDLPRQTSGDANNSAYGHHPMAYGRQRANTSTQDQSGGLAPDGIKWSRRP